MKLLSTQLQKRLFHSACIVCREKTHQPLCNPCFELLPHHTHGCYQCADRSVTPHSQRYHCGQCLSTPPAYDRTIAPFLYQGFIQSWVLDLKFHQRIRRATYLARLFTSQLATYYSNHDLPSLIIPIPLHQKRLQQRGYNQAHCIAYHINRLTHIPTTSTVLKRHRSTQPQAQITLAERKKNVSHAFTCTTTHLPRHIAVLDDVMTTGHTLNAACKTLKHSGAQRIDAWVIARSCLAKSI